LIQEQIFIHMPLEPEYRPTFSPGQVAQYL